MLYAFSEVVASTGALPPELVPARSRDLLVSSLATLPAMTLQSFVECRLHASDEQVDVSLLVPTGEGRRRLATLREPLGGTSAWAPVFAFVATWLDEGSVLHRGVPFIWLELDHRADGLAAPFVVFSLQPSHYQPSHAPPGPTGVAELTSPSEAQTVLEAGLGALRADPMPDAMKRCLDRCLRALPPGGFPTYAASLTTRGEDTVRLNVAVPSGHLFEYLEAIGWSGPLPALRRLLHDTGVPPGVPAGTVWFDLDVGAEVRPSIKLDYHFPAGDQRWVHLFERLVASGLATSEKAAAAMAWPGVSSITLPGRRHPCGFRRGLTVKLCCAAGPRPLEAKAYLDFACPFSLFA